MLELALIGDPVAHSMSPPMHEAALRELGLEGRYRAMPLSADELPRVFHEGLDGFNVTVPHKEAIVPLLDEVSDEARAIGAVNTVRAERSGGVTRWHGTNTDGAGLIASLRTMGDLPSSALILGAGGSARAAAYALAREGVDVVVSARRSTQADGLCDVHSRVHTRPWPPALDRVLVINATSATLDDERARAFADTLPFARHEGQTFLDLVYGTLDGAFARRARDAGAQVIDGRGMLVHQGALALEFWTGLPAPVDVMAAVVDRCLEDKRR